MSYVSGDNGAGIGTLIVFCGILAAWWSGKILGKLEAPIAAAAAPPGAFRASPRQLKTLTTAAVAVHAFFSE